MAIAAVGTATFAEFVTGGTTLVLSPGPTAIGNAVVLQVTVFSSLITVTGVSGGGCTWAQAEPVYAPGGANLQWWIGECITTGASTITVTFSGSVAAVVTCLTAQEFSPGVSNPVWQVDGSQFGNLQDASSSVVVFPTLTAAASGELYVGFGIPAGSMSGGVGSGFVFQFSGGNALIYNVNVAAGSVTATCTETVGVATTTALLLKVAQRDAKRIRMVRRATPVTAFPSVMWSPQAAPPSVVTYPPLAGIRLRRGLHLLSGIRPRINRYRRDAAAAVVPNWTKAQADVTSGSGSDSLTNTATLGVPATAGNLLVAAVNWDAPGATTTLSLPGSGWALATASVPLDSSSFAAIFYKVAAGGETGVTFTWTAVASSTVYLTERVQPTAGTIVLDTTAQYPGATSTSCDIGLITTAQQNDLLIGMVGTDHSDTYGSWDAGSGFNQVVEAAELHGSGTVPITMSVVSGQAGQPQTYGDRLNFPALIALPQGLTAAFAVVVVTTPPPPPPGLIVLGQSISTRYAAALKAYQGGTATLAQVWGGNVMLQTLAIDANGSVVNTDRAAVIRRTGSVALTDPTGTLVPTTVHTLLNPTSGNEIVLYRGITYPNSDQELIQLGVFGIEDAVINDSAQDLVITLTLNDRSRVIQRAGFGDVYVIAPGTNVGTAIQALIAFQWNGAPLAYNFAPTTAVTQTTPLVYQPGDDPWQKCLDLAAGCGFQVYFDRTGNPTFKPVPDPKVQPTAWSYDEGVGNIATGLTRTISRAKAPNIIIRDGQGSGIAVPVRGLSIDNDPTSKTYWRGPYGPVRDFASSALYATQAQAQAASDAALLLAKGTIESLQVLAVPKPDSDVDDVIEVTRVRDGLANRYVIDSLTLGFGPAGVLSFTGRQIS
jgi:hypothetical protein